MYYVQYSDYLKIPTIKIIIIIVFIVGINTIIIFLWLICRAAEVLT